MVWTKVSSKEVGRGWALRRLPEPCGSLRQLQCARHSAKGFPHKTRKRQVFSLLLIQHCIVDLSQCNKAKRKGKKLRRQTDRQKVGWREGGREEKGREGEGRGGKRMKEKCIKNENEEVTLSLLADNIILYGKKS